MVFYSKNTFLCLNVNFVVTPFVIVNYIFYNYIKKTWKLHKLLITWEMTFRLQVDNFFYRNIGDQSIIPKYIIS